MDGGRARYADAQGRRRSAARRPVGVEGAGLMAGFRLPHGGNRIDRKRPLQFTFDGAAVRGFAGDTVASALIASGRTLVARSFKYHRPRGIFSAGPEEPNALVTLGSGAATEPN